MTSNKASEAKTCLVLSDGRRGIENQALGLAERFSEICAADFTVKLQTYHLQHSAALSALPPKAQLRLARFELPHCDIAIGCGRQAIAPLLHLKKNRPDVPTVYVQDPRISSDHFDLVVAPEHDNVKGGNVISMIGSPNRMTETKIIGETLSFAQGLKELSMPRAALLIWGKSKTHHLDQDSHAAHISAAKNLMAAGQSVMITTSRRTPEFAVTEWKRFASDHDRVWLHHGDGPNPYFAFLGGAELILVTEDSTNMLIEACATGKPVYRLPMAGKPGKFQTLYDALETRCDVVPYSGQMDGQSYDPLDETNRVARDMLETIRQRIC